MSKSRKDHGRLVAFHESERVSQLPDGAWEVEGSKGDSYRVDPVTGECGCPDKMYREDRKHRCYHFWAVFFTSLEPVEYKIGRRKSGQYFIAITRYGQLIEVVGGVLNTKEEALEAKRMLDGQSMEGKVA